MKLFVAFWMLSLTMVSTTSLAQTTIPSSLRVYVLADRTLLAADPSKRESGNATAVSTDQTKLAADRVQASADHSSFRTDLKSLRADLIAYLQTERSGLQPVQASSRLEAPPGYSGVGSGDSGRGSNERRRR